MSTQDHILLRQVVARHNMHQQPFIRQKSQDHHIRQKQKPMQSKVQVQKEWSIFFHIQHFLQIEFV